MGYMKDDGIYMTVAQEWSLLSHDKQDKYLMPILRILADGEVHQCEPSMHVEPDHLLPDDKGMYSRIAKMARLTEAQMHIKDDGNLYEWQHNVRWAISALCRAMAIQNLGRSRYRIAPFGRELLAEGNVTVLKTKLPSRKWWLYSLGDDVNGQWEEMIAKGEMALKDVGLGDLSGCRGKRSFVSLLNRRFGDEPRPDVTDWYWSFLDTMEGDNVVFVRRGGFDIVGYGIVRSDYRYEPGRHVRDVEWRPLDKPLTIAMDQHPMLYPLKAGSKERLRIEKAYAEAGMDLYVEGRM